jgi:hypothetical protein
MNYSIVLYVSIAIILIGITAYFLLQKESFDEMQIGSWYDFYTYDFHSQTKGNLVNTNLLSNSVSKCFLVKNKISRPIYKISVVYESNETVNVMVTRTDKDDKIITDPTFFSMNTESPGTQEYIFETAPQEGILICMDTPIKVIAHVH